MKRPIKYSDEELAWIKENSTLPRAEAYKLFYARFGRDDVTVDNFTALCKRKGWLTGRDGRIMPGGTSWNKGKKMPFNEHSAKTQFKKGQKPHNVMPVGHTRMHEDGYLYVNIEETNPHTGYGRRYVLKHKHLWEKKHGAIPDGMCLKCLDGNRANTDPSNWDLIARGALPLLNGRWAPGYDESAPEVKPVLLTLAKLKHARKQKTRKDGKDVK